MASEKFYTTSEVGDLLQVNASSVVKWVNDGLLHAYNTPGGHRRLGSRDILVFLRKHGMYVPPELAGIKRKLLFVDDHEPLLKSMKRAMKPYASEVEFLTADSGVEALMKIGLDKPDVLFLDYAMPDLDGLEVLRRLKARPETAGIEVVLITGSVRADVKKKALALGAKAVCPKPFTAENLIEVAGVRASA